MSSKTGSGLAAALTDAPGQALNAASPTQFGALREACGLLDRSERGKLAVTGADSAAFLNGLLSNDILALSPGGGCSAALLDHKGKMLALLRVISTPRPRQELWLDCERHCLQALFDGLRRFGIGYAAELDKRTLQQGLISLVGPRSEEMLGAATAGGSAKKLAEHDSRWVRLGSTEALAVGTEVGVDLVCDAQATENVSRALLDAGAERVAEDAVECLRVERGRPRYGIDIDHTTIPEEAGLNEQVVSFTKGCYVGQETVARLHYKGRPNRHLRGLRLSAPAQTGDELRVAQKVVGRLGSVALSPAYGPIALALVRREAQPGDHVAVGAAGATARVVALPFG